MGSSPLLTLAHPTLWKFMGHQFISLYRQEVNIDFLLQFFHPLFFTAQYQMLRNKSVLTGRSSVYKFI